MEDNMWKSVNNCETCSSLSTINDIFSNSSKEKCYIVGYYKSHVQRLYGYYILEFCQSIKRVCITFKGILEMDHILNYKQGLIILGSYRRTHRISLKPLYVRGGGFLNSTYREIQKVAYSISHIFHCTVLLCTLHLL